MRTEYKAGLFVGLLAIGATAIYFFSAGGDKEQPDRIPFNVATGTEADDPRTAAREQGTPRSTPPAGPATARRTSPRTSTAQPAQRPTPAPTRTPVITPTTGAPTTTQPAERPAGTPTRTATTQPATQIPAQPTTQPAARMTPRAQPAVPVPARETEQPGTRLGPRRVQDAPKPSAAPVRYTVQRGDTLSSIARDHYGEGRDWRKIRDANPDIDPQPAEDRPGSSSCRPRTQPPQRRRPEPALPAVRGRRTWSSRATRSRASPATSLATAHGWREIYELNRDQLESPDDIKPGVELRLPPGRALDPRAPATPSRAPLRKSCSGVRLAGRGRVARGFSRGGHELGPRSAATYRAAPARRPNR